MFHFLFCECGKSVSARNRIWHRNISLKLLTEKLFVVDSPFLHNVQHSRTSSFLLRFIFYVFLLLLLLILLVFLLHFGDMCLCVWHVRHGRLIYVKQKHSDFYQSHTFFSLSASPSVNCMANETAKNMNMKNKSNQQPFKLMVSPLNDSNLII